MNVNFLNRISNVNHLVFIYLVASILLSCGVFVSDKKRNAGDSAKEEKKVLPEPPKSFKLAINLNQNSAGNILEVKEKNDKKIGTVLIDIFILKVDKIRFLKDEISVFIEDKPFAIDLVKGSLNNLDSYQLVGEIDAIDISVNPEFSMFEGRYFNSALLHE